MGIHLQLCQLELSELLVSSHQGRELCHVRCTTHNIDTIQIDCMELHCVLQYTGLQLQWHNVILGREGNQLQSLQPCQLTQLGCTAGAELLVAQSCKPQVAESLQGFKA